MDPVMLLPLGASVLLWLVGARLGRWLPPATAVRLLTAAALVTALATGFVLADAAFVMLAQLPPVAALGHWSAGAVHMADPIPMPVSDTVGLLSGATVAVLLGAALRRTTRAGRDLVQAAMTCRRLGPGAAGLVVVDDDRPDAAAAPACPRHRPHRAGPRDRGCGGRYGARHREPVRSRPGRLPRLRLTGRRA